MKTITEEMRKKLREPLPSGAVSQHPTKTYLSSIKAIYVTERLSDVFGIGAWRFKVEKIVDGDKGMVVVKIIFEIPEYNVYYESFGGNDNGGETSKNFDLGDAYKGATTDALTKIGSFLEIGIDVFKGLHKQNTKNEYMDDDRAWLSEGNFNKIKDRIIAGESDLVEKTIAAFKMKKEYKEQLIHLKK